MRSTLGRSHRDEWIGTIVARAPPSFLRLSEMALIREISLLSESSAPTPKKKEHNLRQYIQKHRFEFRRVRSIHDLSQSSPSIQVPGYTSCQANVRVVQANICQPERFSAHRHSIPYLARWSGSIKDFEPVAVVS